MKIKKWTLIATAGIALCFFPAACQKWGLADPPAGNQVYPKLEQLMSLTFEEELNPEEIELFAHPNGNQPTLVEDEEHGKVLYAGEGYARMPNPLNKVKVQNAVSLTMWIKQSASDEAQGLTRPLFSFLDAEGRGLSFAANGGLKYTGAAGSYEDSDPALGEALTADGWHYLAIAITNAGYLVHVDSAKVIDKAVADFDMPALVQSVAALPYFYIAYGAPDAQPNEIRMDDLKIYRNTIGEKEASMPVTGGGGEDEPLTELVYLNTFDDPNGAQIEGAGMFVEADDPKFGKVFKNATGGTRQNYLKLPSNVLSHSTETKEMTIGVWVNAAGAGEAGAYMWSPLLTAYGAAPVDNANTWPMLALQYRGVVQVNNSGWCDFTDAQNVNGANALYHDATDWLADRGWHYYTATFTETSAKVYFDGVPVNEWAVDGNSDGAVIRGLFSNGADLSYICLGGNQAWNWGDPDPGFMFDDFAVYNVALTAEQISVIINRKEHPELVYLNTFDILNDAQLEGSGAFVEVANPKFGKVFKNATGGTRQNYLKLPSDVLSHSTATKEMTIGVWVNAGGAGESGAYMWSPLFTAYGAAPVDNANTWPMLALQYRGVVQVNNSGWCDFTDAQNVNGANALYHDATDWLADREWHYYTATFTETSAKVYFDGVPVNEWAVDGNSDGAVIRGLFSNGADLSYACLGGNQAWNWGDPDPGFMFDDFAVYNVALTAEQILSIIAEKKK